ncbi:hypothetical protein [Subtercola vilae]|uniref:hypothetical protein n=1 Tax=Subtercola vilae TaxID=2056433 RepID=UPI0013757A63|nr:hypothetical protein [Subtercola vilae]
MQVTDTSFLWLQQANEERFTRELEYRRVAAERLDEQRAARRSDSSWWSRFGRRR